MSIATDIYALLNTTANVTAYPDQLPHNVSYPCVTYEINSGDFLTAFDGDADLEQYDVTVTCYGKTRSSAATTAESVKTALHALSRSALAALKTAGTISGDYARITINYGTSYADFETQTYSQDLTLDISKI